ncbi:Zinc/iron permease [Paraphysoderma sedebokerense]|nr:Zinc/iron permease [Paraphysoderma sedebokerense]KAI9137863.1 Zinc/iron permease [Paraphysoderma sedebokerense]
MLINVCLITMYVECGNYSLGYYDTPLHIGAIFIILVVSLIGAIIPVLIRRYRWGVKHSAILICKAFGSGIVIATGFVHLLFPAFAGLTSSCAPQVFQDYQSFPGLIALTTALMMHLTEFYALQKKYDNEVSQAQKLKNENQVTTTESVEKGHIAGEGLPGEEDIKVFNEKGKTKEDRKEDGSLQGLVGGCNHHSHGGHVVPRDEDEEENDAKSVGKRISVWMLEFGIASHSVIIGLALGITTTDFVPLLIAIAFHQFFEGFALGAMIADTGFNYTKSIWMVLIYSFSTPLGIAIGVAVANRFNPNGPEAMVVSGIFHSAGAGILLYSALVNIIAQDLLSRQFMKLPKRQKVYQFIALYIGAGVMSLIGKWA